MWADAPKGLQRCLGRLQQESNNDQVVCCCLQWRGQSKVQPSKEKTMRVPLTTVAVLAFSGAALAQQGGTEQEARAMLDKAIAAVKADQVVAIIKFTKGEDGFLDRDLYPFCFRISDAKTLATPKAVKAGTDIRTLKDNKGEAYGEAIYAAAQKPEGQITEIKPYMFPKPGTTEPLFPKISFVTNVGGLGCGVGYYK
jgi:hypothetical protein